MVLPLVGLHSAGVCHFGQHNPSCRHVQFWDGRLLCLQQARVHNPTLNASINLKPGNHCSKTTELGAFSKEMLQSYELCLPRDCRRWVLINLESEKWDGLSQSGKITCLPGACGSSRLLETAPQHHSWPQTNTRAGKSSKWMMAKGMRPSVSGAAAALLWRLRRKDPDQLGLSVPVGQLAKVSILQGEVILVYPKHNLYRVCLNFRTFDYLEVALTLNKNWTGSAISSAPAAPKSSPA